ncbi:ABC transporter ATP-binding protein [Paenibacillus methanolicus]|uniref:ATP-binding cassette subfamily B protein n=1 Tax=Paenibacillus methanolicus TaxID=582686 RepID=A0A5S5CAQ6_9BACL|nr:ABC transporter ATP-binding protein [Paenibacillus methanolicus]TYP75446.1 ATP-binding cassette subfamily B protein [Paenibacillus methanolicus]
MLKLMRYLKPYWRTALLAPLFMLLEVIMDLLQPRLMASIVNDGVTAGNLDHIIRTGLDMLGVALVGLIGGVGCTVFSTQASQRFGTDLRQALFAKIQSLSAPSLDRFGAGSLVTRLTGDIAQLQQMVLLTLRIVARCLFLAVGSIVMAVLISPKLSLILLAMIPVLVVFLVVMTKMTVPMYGAVQEKLDGVNAVLQENLSGIRVVKAFVRGDYEERRFGEANGRFLEASLKAARVAALNGPLMSVILNFSIVVALWYGGGLTEKGLLEVGSLAAFLAYVTELLFAIVGLGGQLMMIARAKASARRIAELLDTRSDKATDERIMGRLDGRAADPEGRAARLGDVADHDARADKPTLEGLGAHARCGSLEFRGVGFSYGGASGPRVLADIDFRAEPGETIGIVGVNGAGKSTLVSLIPRLYEATEGQILIDGTDIRDLAPEELHREVGVVLQQALLFTGTIRDNIRYGKPDAAEEEIVAAARAAQAHDFIAALPDGYDTELGQRGVNLSGGQKQRISIARSLLAKPRILILDDCTSAVDLNTDRRIRQSLQTLMKETTCLVIGQRIASIEHADRILVLEEGRITASGTHEELLRRSHLYRDIAASQQGA